MNSISNFWDSTKREETPYSHRGPSSQNEEKRVNEKKGMRMDKSKGNTLIYIHMYIYTHPQTYKHI